MANQLAGYLALFKQFSSPEMSEARKFVASLDICDERSAAAQVEAGLDPRILAVGNFFNEVSGLVRSHVLERNLFMTMLWQSSTLWPKLAPYTFALRRKQRVAIWSDVQYMAQLAKSEDMPRMIKRSYPRWFRRVLDKEMAAAPFEPTTFRKRRSGER